MAWSDWRTIPVTIQSLRQAMVELCWAVNERKLALGYGEEELVQFKIANGTTKAWPTSEDLSGALVTGPNTIVEYNLALMQTELSTLWQATGENNWAAQFVSATQTPGTSEVWTITAQPTADQIAYGGHTFWWIGYENNPAIYGTVFDAAVTVDVAVQAAAIQTYLNTFAPAGHTWSVSGSRDGIVQTYLCTHSTPAGSQASPISVYVARALDPAYHDPAVCYPTVAATAIVTTPAVQPSYAEVTQDTFRAAGGNGGAWYALDSILNPLPWRQIAAVLEAMTTIRYKFHGGSYTVNQRTSSGAGTPEVAWTAAVGATPTVQNEGRCKWSVTGSGPYDALYEDQSVVDWVQWATIKGEVLIGILHSGYEAHGLQEQPMLSPLGNPVDRVYVTPPYGPWGCHNTTGLHYVYDSDEHDVIEVLTSWPVPGTVPTAYIYVGPHSPLTDYPFRASTIGDITVRHYDPATYPALQATAYTLLSQGHGLTYA